MVKVSDVESEDLEKEGTRTILNAIKASEIENGEGEK